MRNRPGKAMKFRQAAEEPALRYVMEGSLQSTGDEVRIKALRSMEPPAKKFDGTDGSLLII
jgi:TolB-like protein